MYPRLIRCRPGAAASKHLCAARTNCRWFGILCAGGWPKGVRFTWFVRESTRPERKASKPLPPLQQLLAPYKVALLHGRLPAREKEQVMAAFRSQAAQILLGTSIIEVGVDVPNATVMVVENAEQFGLAQLHQLRGRIGRGAEDSSCILVAAALGKESRQRLQVLASSSDGFEIAEADLRLRGPGELLGREQSGAPRFRLNGDLSVIHLARELAGKLLGTK